MKARTFISIWTVCVLAGALLVQVPRVAGISTTIVINEFRTRGPNGGSDEFVEIRNISMAPVDIGGWTLRGSNNAGGVSVRATVPAGTMVQPGCFFLFTNSSTSGGPYSGSVPGDLTYATGIADDGGLAIANPSGTIVDQVGMSTGSAFKEGMPLTPLATNVDRGYERIGADTDNNATDFAVLAPSNPQNRFSPCGPTTNPSGTGAANPSFGEVGTVTLLKVTVTPGTNPTSTGLAVTANLTAIGGPAAQMFFDDGTNGDATAGDNVFSFLTSVGGAATVGNKSLPVTITDAQNRTGNATIPFQVLVFSEVVISEFRTRGPSGGNDEFIELHNHTTAPVDISGWKLRGSNSAGTVSTRATIPTGTIIAPGCFYLAVNTASGGFSGGVMGDLGYATGITDDGGIALTLPDDSPVDAVGMSAGSAFKERMPLAPLTTSVNRSYERKPGGTDGHDEDTNNNTADFQLLTPSNPQNSASDCIAVGNPTPPTGTGDASPAVLDPGQSTLLTVNVRPGRRPTSTALAVHADLSAIGGAAMQMFFDDGTNGDATPGDNVFSFQYTLPASLAPGDQMLPATITDGEGRSGSATIALVVVANLAIHEIQGTGNTSPHVGFVVRTDGIVTGVKSNGFFIQTPDSDVDSDPLTSEGIFVFTGSMLPAEAMTGNHVRVLATVAEFRPDPLAPSITELMGQPQLAVTLLQANQPLPAPVTLTAADTQPGGGHEQLERYEGMRVHVSSLTVVAPTDGFVSETSATSTSNGRFFGVITGTARPFREPGVDIFDPLPMGSPCCVPRFDGNPERLRIQSGPTNVGGIGSPTIDVPTGAMLMDVVGPLEYAFRTWTILVDPAALPTVTGTLSATPVPARGTNEYTVASFNLERFFDAVNDPAIGEPVLTPAAFHSRLGKASMAIRNVMRAPDIIGVQEVENLATLQALADRINADAASAAIQYSAYLVEGNDVGGIDVGFLVNTARVAVLDVTQAGKTETFTNPNNGMQEILNDRPPLVLRAEILAPQPPNTPVTVIVNHLRSFIDIESPTAAGNRVRHKRRAQAEYLANFVQSRQAANPDEFIILVGDFNAFPFNDGYVDSMGIIAGMPAPNDQVVLGSTDLVNPDLINLVTQADAAERYSFIFDGSAQVLDHVLISGNLFDCFSRFHYARNNADSPETFRGDFSRPERVSDHDMPVAYFFQTPIPVMVDIRPGTFPNPINLGANGVVPVAILSSATFDAAQVNPLSVELAGANVRLRGNGTPQASLEDVNGDGRRDLVLHVNTSALELSSGDTEAVLTGMTYDGRRVRGRDSVRVVP